MIEELDGRKVYSPYVRMPVIDLDGELGLQWYAEECDTEFAESEVLGVNWAASRVGLNYYGIYVGSRHSDLVNLVVF